MAWLDTLGSTFLDQQMLNCVSAALEKKNSNVSANKDAGTGFIRLSFNTPNGVIMAPSFLTIISSGSENSIAMHLSIAFGNSLFKQI